MSQYEKNNTTRARLRRTILNAIKRCENPANPAYSRYGGRGIYVASEWRDDLDVFEHWARDNGYAPNLTLDRIDNDGPYSPENCRWTDWHTQQRNRRGLRPLTAFGETKCLSEWLEDARCIIEREALKGRLARGEAAEAAMTRPIDVRKSSRHRC